MPEKFDLNSFLFFFKKEKKMLEVWMMDGYGVFVCVCVCARACVRACAR
jgi:hypothetical protein